MESDVPIHAEHLTVEFPGNRVALKDLSLHIDDGELVLVLGPSGSGKSCFALCLDGIVPQLVPARCSGTLRVNGRDPASTPVATMAAEVGLVFQDPDAQLIAVHVEDEIVFGPENLLLERDEIGRRLHQALALVGMQEHRESNTWSLSGGQKQRVAIGSVLSMQPSILVLDEPTSNLDPEGTQAVLELLVRLRREGRVTIIAIEHKIDALIEHVDRLLVFEQGRLLADGPPREIIARHGADLMALGIELPRVSELSLAAGRRGLARVDEQLPITAREARTRWPMMPFQSPPPAAPVVAHAPARQIAREPLLHFQDVSFRYPGRPPALRDVTLSIHAGELVAIAGQNGAGKTTLTRLIIGLLRPTRGKVTLRGEDVARMRPERLSENIGYVFQSPDNQLVADTVFEEVAFSLRLRELHRDEVQVRVEQAMATVGLAGVLARHPLTLSMGEKRRLSVATMLVLEQQILILDEPTMGMDRKHIAAIMDICRALVARGRTVLMVTHDMQVIADWADRVIVLSRGQVLRDAPPRDFFLGQSASPGPHPVRTHLGLLPVCSWRDCHDDPRARCATCREDFLDALLAQHAGLAREAPG